PPTPPALPDPPPRTAGGAVWQTSGALFLIGLAAAWGLERRRVHRSWLTESWRRALGALPGPYHVDIHVRDLHTRLPRGDVEDAANILGRIYRTDERTRELDPRESLRLTLRKGLLPCLVFRRVRTARPIVVLQDLGLDMDMWRAKVERLLFDLRRQGVVLERWYFDGDPRRLSERPSGPPRDVSDVFKHQTDSPVLVVSAGGSLEAITDEGRWLELFARPRFAWLTPVSDTRLWPAVLTSPSVRAWPMTRDGLTGAARALAGQETAEWIRTAVLSEGHVLGDDIERVKRLASLVPHPTPELLEKLRQKFTPDVSDAAVAHVASAAGAGGMREIRLPDIEITRLASAVRSDSPTLEAAVRAEVVRSLDDSEPPTGSAAHLRWQLARAIQQERLADLGYGDVVAAKAMLGELQQGPIWEEARRAATRPLDDRRDASMATPPTGIPPLALTPAPRVSPGLRELLLAAAAAVILVSVAWQAGLFPVEAFARDQNAYVLRLGTGDTLAIELSGAATEPRVVDLYRDGTLYRGQLTRADAGITRIDLPTDAAGRTYQVQAVRADGNVAQSNPLCVPDAQREVVLIDAHPWARVTITALGDGTQVVAA
ncbi:MAG: hypothetical protein ABL982_24875, partial [Vicinamibacterales bacterium]